MKLLFVIGLLLLTLASCVTQKRCFEKFPPQVITKDSVVFKDTTIYVKQKIVIPGDTVTLTDSIPCPDVKYHKVVKSPSGKTTAKVDIDKGKLTVDCQTDSLTKVIDSLRIEIKTKESYHNEVKIVEKPVTKAPAWVWFLLIGVAIVTVLVILKWVK
jgi:hypothetical protein